MYIEHSNSLKAIFHSGKKLEWLNVASKHQTSVIFIFLPLLEIEKSTQSETENQLFESRGWSSSAFKSLQC